LRRGLSIIDLRWLLVVATLLLLWRGVAALLGVSAAVALSRILRAALIVTLVRHGDGGLCIGSVVERNSKVRAI